MIRIVMRTFFVALFIAAILQVAGVSLSRANDAEKNAEKKPVDVLSKTTTETNAKDIATEIDRRREEILNRERELAEYEKKLKDREAALDAKVKDLEKLRLAISGDLEAQKKNNDEKVMKMVTVFETMSPKAASQVLETTEDQLAVEVLKKMDTKKISKIMNVMDKSRSARLSEMLTGYQKADVLQNPITAALKKTDSSRTPAGQAVAKAPEAPAPVAADKSQPAATGGENKVKGK